MKYEEFNPSNPEYKKVKDLPPEFQEEFVDVEEGGFVRRSAVEESNKKPIYYSEEDADFDSLDVESLQEEALGFNKFVENKDFLINKAPQLISEVDFDDWIVTVTEKLGIKVSNHDNEYYKILNTLDSLLDKVLIITNNFDKDASTLLDAIADSLIKFKKINYRGWSHTVCHTIEKYGRGASFLDSPESREILTKLVNESVVRQKEESGDEGCSSRIIGPIVKFNLIEADIDNLERPYTYKPDQLQDEGYIEILKNKLNNPESYVIKTFLDSSSPLEFYRLTINSGNELPSFLKPEQQIKLLQALRKHIPLELINEFVEKKYNPNGRSITYEELLENFNESMESQEMIKGVYVDVEGTLIQNGREGRLLNKGLVNKLEKLSKDGREVVVFTGGDVGMIEVELKKLGFPDHFLPVHSKSEYKGKVLETLIDDTPPEYQGFRAREFRSPSIRSWGNRRRPR